MSQDTRFSFERSPLRVFVLWHPAYAQGKELAERLYEWFGGPESELHRGGLGVPVQPWTSRDHNQVPPQIPWSTQDTTVVVALIDAELAGRPAWRQWIEDLDALARERPEGRLVLLPWAVHMAAIHIGVVSSSQLLGSGPCDSEALNRLVTEACALALLREAEQQPEGGLSPPVGDLQVFISYARNDGSPIALEVRRILQDYGHIRAFLDELDISPGHDWHSRLTNALDTGAAMVAVVTDDYASRPWCREELRTFREPRAVDQREDHWWLPPVYVLDNLKGRATRSMFEVGSAPAARWVPERAVELVDQLIREILFGAQQRARARRIPVPRGSGRVVINWVPDTWTILALSRKVGSRNRRLKEVVYPGDGLPGVERKRLVDAFSDAFPGLRFTSFDEAEHELGRREDEDHGLRPAVAISVSDPPIEDLVVRGVSTQQLDDTVLRVGRLALRQGLDIVYGGKPRDGFTAGLQQDSGTLVLRPRLVNYLGWPWTERLTPKQVADGLGVCRYLKVPAPWAPQPVPEKPEPEDLIRASTEMREAIAGGSHRDLEGQPVGQRIAQIVFGGQLSGYLGIMPGIFEEVLIALERKLKIFLIGGFGGAAGALADYLCDGVPLEESLSPPPPGTDSDLHERRAQALQSLTRRLTLARERRDLGNGLTWKENRALMRTLDGAQIVALVGKGLQQPMEMRAEGPDGSDALPS